MTLQSNLTCKLCSIKSTLSTVHISQRATDECQKNKIRTPMIIAATAAHRHRRALWIVWTKTENGTISN